MPQKVRIVVRIIEWDKDNYWPIRVVYILLINGEEKEFYYSWVKAKSRESEELKNLYDSQLTKKPDTKSGYIDDGHWLDFPYEYVVDPLDDILFLIAAFGLFILLFPGATSREAKSFDNSDEAKNEFEKISMSINPPPEPR